MTDRPIYWLVPAAALLSLVILVDLVRKRRLLETHALLWMLTSVFVAAGPLILPLLDRLALAVGIYYPPALYLLIGIFFLMANTLKNTLDISRLTEQNRRLTQEVAILRSQVETGRRPETAEPDRS
jgi:predicted membrane-bound dolichyl-phosphate-mannose-protein mannosyltransferase